MASKGFNQFKRTSNIGLGIFNGINLASLIMNKGMLILSMLGMIALGSFPGIKYAVKMHAPKISSDSSQINIISNYSKIQSVSGLLQLFNGRPVFIDLWASWCEPCLEEFKYSRRLHDFLLKHGIEIIYVSIDTDKADAIWRNTIFQYGLLGNHIRASKPLRDSLTTLIWGGVDVYAIPNYLLFDRHKKLLNKHSHSPSEAVALFQEIQSELK